MKRSWMIFAVLTFIVAVTVGCSGGGDDPNKDNAPPSPAPAKDQKDGKSAKKVELPKLEATTVGSLPAFKAGHVYLAGQPSEDDLKKFADAGGKTVVSLRLPDEQVGFDENAVVTALGMKFHNPGFRKADSLSEPIFWRVRDLLKNKHEQPLLLHCASANRVGAMWLAHRVLDGQMDYDQAMTEAKQVGLKPQAYEAVVKQYIDHEKKNNAPE